MKRLFGLKLGHTIVHKGRQVLKFQGLLKALGLSDNYCSSFVFSISKLNREAAHIAISTASDGDPYKVNPYIETSGCIGDTLHLGKGRTLTICSLNHKEIKFELEDSVMED